MGEPGQQLRVPAIRFERRLPASIEIVWAHLTDCRKLPNWYGEDGMIEPRQGGVVKLMSGHIRGTVTQFQPQQRLAYTWNVFGPGESKSAYPESYLTIDLAADGAATKLTLSHLPVLERFEKQNAMGWHVFLDMLGDAVSGRAVQPRAAYAQEAAKLYDVDLKNLQT